MIPYRVTDGANLVTLDAQHNSQHLCFSYSSLISGLPLLIPYSNNEHIIKITTGNAHPAMQPFGHEKLLSVDQ